MPIPEERPLLPGSLRMPTELTQPMTPRSPQPQGPESPLSVVLMQPKSPAAPPGEPFRPLEDLTVSIDEKVCPHSLLSTECHALLSSPLCSGCTTVAKAQRLR